MKCDKEENLQIIKQIHRNSLSPSFPIFLSYAHTDTQILFFGLHSLNYKIYAICSESKLFFSLSFTVIKRTTNKMN